MLLTLPKRTTTERLRSAMKFVLAAIEVVEIDGTGVLWRK